MQNLESTGVRARAIGVCVPFWKEPEPAGLSKILNYLGDNVNLI
jgi:hypothetical protein